jgi:hypothetical protein
LDYLFVFSRTVICPAATRRTWWFFSRLIPAGSERFRTNLNDERGNFSRPSQFIAPQSGPEAGSPRFDQ